MSAGTAVAGIVVAPSTQRRSSVRFPFRDGEVEEIEMGLEMGLEMELERELEMEVEEQEDEEVVE